MRTALISDIHANEIALNAVLEDVRKTGVDDVICLGDVATLGSEPHATVRRIQELGCPCVMGNHDAFLLDPPLIHAYTQDSLIIEAVDWCRNQLTTEDLDFIRSFVPSLRVALEGETSLLIYHGSARSMMEDILATASPEELDRMLGDERATVMAFGHTHIQMLRQHRGTLVVNPGSVGSPFKEYVNRQTPDLMDHAEYAVIASDRSGVGVTLRRVPMDKAVLRERAARSDNPLRDYYLKQYA